MLENLKSMPVAGIIVIVVILILFVLALILLFHVFNRYRRISRQVDSREVPDTRFLRYTVNEFADAYKKYGTDTNTPAIVSEAVSSKLGGLLLCERFLNNAVSLFVTLGLFGTFLGLSLSVGSLTELIGYSNTEEWLSVLDSVGGGLMSALSGMGVAFYTSLVGVACSILLTILRSIFSPSAARELMETRLELCLDQSVAASLPTQTAKSDVELVHQMIDALNQASSSMDKTLKDATTGMQYSLAAFNKTVDSFNSSLHDFSEVDYNFRGTVERLDLSIRDITQALRGSSRSSRTADYERSNE